MKAALWIVALCAQAALAQTPAAPAAVPAPAPACADAAFADFDFWVGAWDVFGPAGRKAGDSRIEREYGRCVVHEHYAGPGGYTGESLNIYDAARKVWHQTWVDNGGLLLVIEGGLRDGRMVMEGTTAGPAGGLQRITWAPNADGTVRQHWESRSGDGPWKTVFDGRYVRKAP